MGSKKKFISRMEKCKDWVIWCKPKNARMLRLSGVKNPLGFWNYDRPLNQNMYILNGDHSFSYWSTMSGSYQTGSFHSEDYVLNKAFKAFKNDNYTLTDDVLTTLCNEDFEDAKLVDAILQVDGFGYHSRLTQQRRRNSGSAEFVENWDGIPFPPLFLWGGENVKLNGQVGKLIPTPNTKHYFEKWANVKVELQDNSIVTAKAYEITRL